MLGRLIIFTRFPEPGRVKTRLIPTLGPDAAAELHRRLTAHTLNWAAKLMASRTAQVEVYFDGGDIPRMKECFGDHLCYKEQGQGDLGDRLISAISDGVEPAVVIGTDCPTLGTNHILEAFDALRTRDIVLGPASDGGYYLIGMKKLVPHVFNRIDWGTATVCRATQLIAARQGLSVALLEVLSDVDRPEDLNALDDRFMPARKP